jgi:hypothetical protein
MTFHLFQVNTGPQPIVANARGRQRQTIAEQRGRPTRARRYQPDRDEAAGFVGGAQAVPLVVERGATGRRAAGSAC